MRIAMIGGRGVPARAGGVEHVIDQLARELHSFGHDVLVYSRKHYVGKSEPPEYAQRILTPGFRGKRLDTLTHSTSAMFDVAFRNVDVVHVHSPGPALGAWIPWMARKPILFTVHAPDWRRNRWSKLAKLSIRAGLNIGMKLSDEITCVSADLAEELSSHFGRIVQYIPNGVRIQVPPDPALLDRWDLQPNRYALHVGRIVPEKRLDVLIDAWKQVDTQIPLIVAGTDDENAYARRCRENAPENVRFVGGQYEEDLASLYANAMMIVHPSGLEGMSLVLLEAASYGRCIIASDISANRDALGDSAIYFSEGKCAELTEQIRRCLEREDLRHMMGQAAKEHVATNNDWKNLAGRMEQIYYRLAAKGR